MKPISYEIIEQTMNKLFTIQPNQSEQLMVQMFREQPLIIAYLLADERDIFNENELQSMSLLGLLIWQSMKQGAPHLPSVPGDLLIDMEENNLHMMEYLKDKPTSQMTQIFRTIFANYAQSEMLGFILDMIMKEVENKNGMIRGDRFSPILLYLKTVIDCFNEVGEDTWYPKIYSE